MKRLHVTTLVIGGGPAGLTAATGLAPHSDVLVLEREAVAGGIPRHCDHSGFGLRDLHRNLRGPAYAERLVKRAEGAGVRIMTSAMVTGWHDAHTVEVTSPGGRFLVDADAIVIATGARERPRHARVIPGDRPDGIYNTGQLQQAVHLHHQRIGHRAVVVGSELVSWSAVMTLREAGCSTVLVATSYDRPDTYALLARLGRLVFGAPVRTGVRVTRIIGRGRVSGVEFEDAAGRREIVACDTVVLSGDWIPDHELFRLAGADMDARTKGPQVDASLRTSIPGVFAIGNVVHPVDTADVAAIDGRHVVAAVRAYLGGAATTADGVSVDVEAPLRWVAPSRYQPSAGAPPRDRLLLWTDRFVRFPVVTVLQGGRILASKRLWWPAAPGRVFRVPAALLRGATRTDGTITIRVR
jgi:thioredoxin reductase